MVVARSCSENDGTCNESKYKTPIHIYIFHKHTEARTINYKSSLYKKLTQWTTRRRTTQVSFHHFQVALPLTVFTFFPALYVLLFLLIVFFCVCVCVFFFFAFFMVPFQVSLISYCLSVASGWNEEWRIPEILPLLLTKLCLCSYYSRLV
jgi:hypothetical protein